jgi:galactose mutarotase-like enzyme
MSAGISALGAELQWLRDADGRDLLWDGDPAFWNGRAPILFPIVGAVAGGVIHVDGAAYELPRHGFARRRSFALVERGPAHVRFRLEADDATRGVYPFDFRLDLVFAIDDATLTVAAELSNPGTRPLPAGVGFHPAFRWPLPYDQPRAAHRLTFAQDEPAPVRRLDGDGLVRPDPLPSPIADRRLALDDGLFEDDALILDRVASRRVTYGAPGAPGLQIDFDDMPMLGLWSKPGAGFLCIEPWAGIADPAGFAGDFSDKPGIVEVPPGATQDFAMRITLVGDLKD